MIGEQMMSDHLGQIVAGLALAVMLAIGGGMIRQGQSVAVIQIEMARVQTDLIHLNAHHHDDRLANLTH